MLEICFYYILGTVFGQVVLRKQRQRFSERLIIGFLVIQVLFQICALPFIYFDTTLTLLIKVWSVFISVVVFVSILLIRKRFAEDIKGISGIIKLNRKSFMAMLLIIVAVCYYVSINGQQNDDAVYYIGLINTTLAMDSMYRFNVYSGMGMDSLYLRRALVTFDIHTASLCKIFNVHPLVLARIGRACLNVILTAATLYLFGLLLYRKDLEQRERKSCILAGMALVMNFMFIGNIYTNSTFLLTRAYEGKAFSANVLILFTIYTCIKIMTEHTRCQYLQLLLLLWASVAVSSSALAVNAVVAVMTLLAYYVVRGIDRTKVKENEKC